jgi:archaellum component FlaC
MTIDERLEALVGRIEALTQRHEALTQRHEALAMNLELLTHDVRDLTADVRELRIAAQQDGENIRALARIAEIHHERITRLEDRAD